MSPQAPLRTMVAQAKAVCHRAWPGLRWDNPVWDLSGWLAFREAQSGSRTVLFVLPGSRTRTGRAPLPPPYGDFAKAVVVLVWQRRRVQVTTLATLARVLRRLWAVGARRGATSPATLRPEDLRETLAAAQRAGQSPQSLYTLGTLLQVIAEELDAFGITAVPLAFRNPVRVPARSGAAELPRPDRPGSRQREGKLPTVETLAAYAACTNHPLNTDERILLRAADLQIILGTRLGEALTIPRDCWIEEPVVDRDGQPVRDPRTGVPLTRCGLRYYPEKGYDLAIDWLAEQDVPMVRRAVTDLQALCAPARAVARWLEEHPGRLWAYAPDAVLSVGALLAHLRYASAEAFGTAMRHRGIRVVAARPAHSPPTEARYRAGDIERAFAPSPHCLAPLRAAGGRVVLRLSDALCVKFTGQFGFTHTFRNFRRPDIIRASDIAKALGGTSGGSVFDRRHLVDVGADGRPRRIQLRTHATRHWKNALYDLGGMSDLQQTWAMHRRDVRQTRAYQHRTAAEITAEMRRFLDLAFPERTALLQEGIRGGAIRGPLAQAYAELQVRDPTQAEVFLQTHATGIHITPWGICANDFTLAPCPRYLQCYDGCRHYHRTADPEEAEGLRDLRDKMAAALDAMRQNAVGEAGGDTWVAMLEAKLANVDRALAIAPGQPPEATPIPVFPDGSDKAQRPDPPTGVL